MHLKHGLLIETRRVGALQSVRGRQVKMPEAVDVRCVVGTATDLSCAITGCTVVRTDFAAVVYVNGCRPPIKLASAALEPVVGVLVPEQQGSGVAGAFVAGDLVWVRVAGVHPLVKDAKTCTADTLVMPAAAGAIADLDNTGRALGLHVGVADIGGGTNEVLLLDPLDLLQTGKV